MYFSTEQSNRTHTQKSISTPLKSIENRPCDIEYNDADDNNVMLFVEDTDGTEVRSVFFTNKPLFLDYNLLVC